MGYGSVATLAALLWAPSAWAAPGTTSPDFLRIGVAPRPTAMGEAYAALADDVYAVAYNPAGLGFLQRQELAFMHHEFVSGVQQEYAAYAYPTNRLGTLALSANLLRVKPFSSFDDKDQPLGHVSAEDLAVSAAYGVAYRQLSIGGNAKHITSRLADSTAKTAAYDAGALVRIAYGFSVGVSVQNLGQGLRYDRERAPLPRMTRAGAAWQGRFLWPGSAAAVTLDGGFARERDPFVSSGLELRLLPQVALRAGYRGSQDDEIQFSWGAGFKIPLSRGKGSGSGNATWQVRYARDESVLPSELEIDYAFVKLGDLGITHRMSLLMRFGRARRKEDPSPSWKSGNFVPYRHD